MRSIKKIGVVTATRADYGLLFPLMQQLVVSTDFELLLFVTGTHLSHEFGYTKNQILSDGFKITEEIECLVSSDTPSAVGKTSGLVLMGLVDAYIRHQPDLIVLLGDRYEILCAAMAANLCRVPIAHIHGGEITEGAYDNNFRHAITKLSHVHFTSSEDHKNRVLQMGEDPGYVFNVGAIGIDNIKNIKVLSKEELEERLHIKFKQNNILVTVHPETLSPGSTKKNIEILLESIGNLKDTFVIFTGSNADSEGRIINKRLKEYTSNNNSCIFVESLGQLQYISVLKIVDVVVGNSSSGIIEVPSFNIPTVNIGNRQKGRMRAESVIDVPWNSKIILNTILEAFDSGIAAVNNPYGNGSAAQQIIKYLKKLDISKNLLFKKFHDYRI